MLIVKFNVMKKFIVVLILICLSFACKKDIPLNVSQVTSTNDLTVNGSFNWQTAKNITITIHPVINGMLIISSPDESMQFHKGFYNDSTLINKITTGIYEK